MEMQQQLCWWYAIQETEKLYHYLLNFYPVHYNTTSITCFKSRCTPSKGDFERDYPQIFSQPHKKHKYISLYFLSWWWLHLAIQWPHSRSKLLPKVMQHFCIKNITTLHTGLAPVDVFSQRPHQIKKCCIAELPRDALKYVLKPRLFHSGTSNHMLYQ